MEWDDLKREEASKEARLVMNISSLSSRPGQEDL